MEHHVEFKNIKHIHFVGVGGIGVSAIARMMKQEGKEVSGSDASETDLLKTLQSEGMEIFVGHRASHINGDIDVVVYTVAIPHNNPELERARELGIPLITYPQALGLLTEEKFTVAVSGTHGKTTTTAMIAEIAIAGGLDPTVIVGSLLKSTNSNFRPGKSNLFIVEACEYKRSFLNLSPDILVITNVDEDHLDYYQDLGDIHTAFREIVGKLPKTGAVVCDPSDPRVTPVLSEDRAEILDYTSAPHDLDLPVPGEHNIRDAQAALSVAKLLGVDEKIARDALSKFQGTWRRAEKKGELADGTLIYDDYAHHPTEIRATLTGFKEKFGGKKLTVIFQPHLYSRTKEFLHEFAEALSIADKVILLPIYAAREAEDPSISSEMLLAEVEKERRNAWFVEEFEDAANLARDEAKSGVLITMGAGDVGKIGDILLR